MSRVEHIGDATLHLGDCREILPTLGPVDAVVTDPPYGIGYKSIGVKKNNRRVSRSAYGRGKVIYGDAESFDPSAALSIGVQHILFGANHYADKLPPSGGWLVWDKRVNPEFYGKTDQSDCELAWGDISGAARVWRQIWNGIVRQGEEANTMRVHPTQKPVALMRWCVGMTTGIVCDPYIGSGTTGVACASLGRKFVGIEIDEGYFDIACKRIAEAYRQADLFVSPPTKEPVDAGIVDLFKETMK